MRQIPFRQRLLAGCVLGCMLIGGARAGVEDCGELSNYSNVGPWDYAHPSSSMSTGADPMGRIKRVENVHFNDGIKNLDLRHFSINRLTAEIDYTLRVFPNHPEALNAISRLEKMAGGKLPQEARSIFVPRISSYCYFDRALRFRPNDRKLHLVYGLHLHRNGKLTEALGEYRMAETLGEESGALFYNFALIQAELKNWDKALEYGQRALESGYMFPALRQKLEQAGRPLKEPVRVPTTPVVADGEAADKDAPAGQ